MSSMTRQRRTRRTRRSFDRERPGAWPVRRCWCRAPGVRHQGTGSARSSGSTRSGSPGPARNDRRCGRACPPTMPASPRRVDNCAAGAPVGVPRRAVHGSRSRSHRARQSGARLPRRATIEWRRRCHRTCAAYGPNRKPVGRHCPCLRPGGQIRPSGPGHRPAQGQAPPSTWRRPRNPFRCVAGCSPLRSSL